MWRVSHDPEAHLVTVRLADHVTITDMHAIAEAHARALAATGGVPFKVLIDARGLFPLEAEAVVLLAAMKRVAAELAGYRALVVLVDGATVAMQQHRTRVVTIKGSTTSRTDATDEVVTTDELEAKRLVAWPAAPALT